MTPAEESLLGAILDAEGPVLKTAGGVLLDLAGLKPEAFQSPKVRVAWTIATRLAERRRPIDAETVFATGASLKAFDGEEDRDWLRRLQNTNALDRERFAEVAEAVRHTLKRSRLEAALRSGLEALGRKDARLDEAVSVVEDALLEVGSFATADSDGSEDVLAVATDWERAENDPAASPLLIPSGLDALDGAIGGFPVNLSVVCGLPSVGKSALLGSIIDAQLTLGLTVGLFGLEDGTRWLIRRILARDLGFALRDIGWKKREGEAADAFPDVASALTERMKRLICFRHDSVKTAELIRRATAWKVRHQIDALYVDHGGEVDHTTAQNQNQDFRLRVADSYREIRNWAIRHQTPAVVLAHTARPGDENEERPPRASEIAESAYIERRARLILGVWRKQNEPDWMRLTVLKQTEGERDVTIRIPRLKTAALLSREGGERVNLEGERNREVREAKAKRLVESQEAREVAKKLAEERKPKPAQKDLLP